MSDLLVSKTGQSSRNYSTTSERGIELFNHLNTFFPTEQIEDYASVTEEYIHEVFGTKCIRTCVPNRVCLDMLGVYTTSAHRVFILASGESFFLANQLFTDEQPVWKPDRSFVLSVMEPYAEYKNNPPANFDSFKEYILAMRPEIAISDLGIAPANTSPNAAYGMLVNTEGEVVAIRSYIGYGEGRGAVETLQGRHLFLCKRYKRVDLARAFRDGNYVD